jgi:NAD(P)H-dependent flavin oxidoreductase YrpB (nitropropane dioxygenase family)
MFIILLFCFRWVLYQRLIMLKNLESVTVSDRQVLPIVEGGKGIGFSNFLTAGNFAKNGCVGTISGVNTDFVDDNGEIVDTKILSKSRLDRHTEMMEASIKGIVSQTKRAFDISGGNGRIHLNVLWEMGGTEYILNETLSRVKGLINGVVCGAGMPYKLSEICAQYKTYYYPIVSSMRAFKILWLRSFKKTKEWLGGVVYECPWQAGGHNGLTNAEDPFKPQNSYERVAELRKFMDENSLKDTPIVVAGGVWNLKEYESWIGDKKIGKIVFQFGTRPMVTKESPLSDYWKQTLLSLKKDGIKTNHFSPTGFWSSAVNNDLLKDLYGQLDREVKYSMVRTDNFNTEIICGKNKKNYFFEESQRDNINKFINSGFTEAIKTPDNTLIFVSESRVQEIQRDMRDCVGCLSCCNFSTWSQYFPDNNYTCGVIPDPRSFCIQKALQNAKRNIEHSRALLFAGSNACRFCSDEMYKNGHIPTIKELIDGLISGK